MVDQITTVSETAMIIIQMIIYEQHNATNDDYMTLKVVNSIADLREQQADGRQPGHVSWPCTRRKGPMHSSSVSAAHIRNSAPDGWK